MEYTEQQKQIYNEVCDKYKHNWLNTTISQAMAMEMINKALTIHSVVSSLPTKEEMHLMVNKTVEEMKKDGFSTTNRAMWSTGYENGFKNAQKHNK